MSPFGINERIIWKLEVEVKGKTKMVSRPGVFKEQLNDEQAKVLLDGWSNPITVSMLHLVKEDV